VQQASLCTPEAVEAVDFRTEEAAASANTQADFGPADSQCPHCLLVPIVAVAAVRQHTLHTRWCGHRQHRQRIQLKTCTALLSAVLGRRCLQLVS